jgi:NADH-quinone oxidoreductase subunit I
MKQYFKNIWLGIYTVLIGMKITLIHLFAKNVTQQYPDRFHPLRDRYWGKRGFRKGDEKHSDIPPFSRNRLFLDYDLCNGCNGCVRACPVNCIEVETVKVTPGDNIPPLKDGSKRGLWVKSYTIDFAKCCYCALCIEPCPTEAIKMVPDFEYSTFDRGNLIVQFSKMTEEEARQKTEMYEKFQAEKKKEKAKPETEQKEE